MGAAAFSSQDFLMSVAEGKAPLSMPAPPVPARRRKVVVGKGR
jgi:hypothetical protein